jgi:hypothetical protein
MEEREKGWTITFEFRTCPLPPYKLEDHASYYGMKRANPDFDWSQADAMIEQVKANVGRRCLDIFIEKNKYMIMTFEGEALFGGMNVDYGKSVIINTNEWNIITTIP